MYSINTKAAGSDVRTRHQLVKVKTIDRTVCNCLFQPIFVMNLTLTRVMRIGRDFPTPQLETNSLKMPQATIILDIGHFLVKCK